MVRQVEAAEQDPHNTAAEAAEARAKQAKADRVLLAVMAEMEFKMLFKQVQINIMPAAVAAELGQCL